MKPPASQQVTQRQAQQLLIHAAYVQTGLNCNPVRAAAAMNLPLLCARSATSVSLLHIMHAYAEAGGVHPICDVSWHHKHVLIRVRSMHCAKLMLCRLRLLTMLCDYHAMSVKSGCCKSARYCSKQGVGLYTTRLVSRSSCSPGQGEQLLLTGKMDSDAPGIKACMFCPTSGKALWDCHLQLVAMQKYCHKVTPYNRAC